MSRQGYDLSKFNRLEWIDARIAELRQDWNKLNDIIAAEQREESEMSEQELEVEEQLLREIALIEQEMDDLEAEYAAIEEETYEEAYRDYKYDQWKDNRNDEE